AHDLVGLAHHRRPGLRRLLAGIRARTCGEIPAVLARDLAHGRYAFPARARLQRRAATQPSLPLPDRRARGHAGRRAAGPRTRRLDGAAAADDLLARPDRRAD